MEIDIEIKIKFKELIFDKIYPIENVIIVMQKSVNNLFLFGIKLVLT